MIGGTVHINEHVIVTWRAWRVDHTEKVADAVNLYNCKVLYEHTDGHHYIGEFSIEHRYGDGALALAGAVLSESVKWMHKDYHPIDSDSVTYQYFSRMLRGLS